MSYLYPTEFVVYSEFVVSGVVFSFALQGIVLLVSLSSSYVVPSGVHKHRNMGTKFPGSFFQSNILQAVFLK